MIWGEAEGEGASQK